MSRVVWSHEAARILTTLPHPVQADILAKCRLLSEFPEMYPARRRGRFRGQRFFIAYEWLVYYMIQQGVVSITSIGHARRRNA